MSCWKCNESVQGIFCVGCGSLQQPAPTLDPFVLLGISPRYHLSDNDIESRYRELARKLHPDRFAGKTALERRLALQWTAQLNEARRILRDPVRRARFLASGRPDPSEQGGVRLDPDFLEEMFIWREQDEDQPGSLKALATTRSQLLEAELDAIFSAWESGLGTLDLVEDRLARLKYIKAMAI